MSLSTLKIKIDLSHYYIIFLKSMASYSVRFLLGKCQGGHQQICRSWILSHSPFIHLLPTSVYRRMLILFGESKECVSELLAIKKTGLSMERFRVLIKSGNLDISQEILWFINPHYQQKFGLMPIKLHVVNKLRYIRNFFTTSYWCILTHKKL